MKAILLLALFAAAYAHEEHPVSHQMVETIRQHATTWEAMEPHENPFYDWTVEEIKGMLGCDLTPIDGVNFPASPEPVEGELASSYDFRTTGCANGVQDQGRCGSCWAFGSTEALADRFCKAGNKQLHDLSSQYQVSCDRANYGCQGGYLDKATDFLVHTGTTAETCNHYKSGAQGKTGTCPTKCDDGSSLKMYKCKTRVHPRTTSAIKKEIQDNGPVETGFTVYQDFMSYKSGVYRHTTGSSLGGHAIKVIGWGSDHWIAQNSWGTSWGEKGYFRIGYGECGFEAQMYACTPLL